jgi:hypothetical protein
MTPLPPGKKLEFSIIFQALTPPKCFSGFTNRRGHRDGGKSEKIQCFFFLGGVSLRGGGLHSPLITGSHSTAVAAAAVLFDGNDFAVVFAIPQSWESVGGMSNFFYIDLRPPTDPNRITDRQCRCVGVFAGHLNSCGTTSLRIANALFIRLLTLPPLPTFASSFFFNAVTASLCFVLALPRSPLHAL